MKRVVFFGNCQLQSLSQLYARFADRARGEAISYIPSYEVLNGERLATLAQADIVVEQRMDVAPRGDIGGVALGGERRFVPLLAGGFMWPFAGQEHPKNEKVWFLPGGPFDGEMSDSYLNRLIEKGVPADEALKQYLALDVNQVRNLDRFFEIIIDRQRSRDEACGFRIADIVAEHFRDEPLFRTPHHPNLRVALAFATQFFEQMEVGAASIERMRQQLKVTPYPKTELPIHPSVARHFGLKYVDENTRFRIRDEGRMTFDEYMASYLRAEWNRDLVEGMALMRTSVASAIVKLEEGLRVGPGSPEGWYTYAEALRRTGRAAEAERAARQAVALDPGEGRHYHALAQALADQGRVQEAVQEADRALSIEAFNPHFHGLAAHLAARQGRHGDALALLRNGIGFDPENPHLHSMISGSLANLGRHGEALASAERAVEFDPASGWFRFGLSHSLLKVGRTEDAVRAAREAAELDPENGAIQAHLKSLVGEYGAPEEIEVQLRRHIEQEPNKPGPYARLGHELLGRLNRPEEAEAAFRQSIEIAPDFEGGWSGLSHTLSRLGRHAEAVAAIREAIALRRGFSPHYVHLGNQLWELRELDEAKSAYEAALAIDPANKDAANQLSRLSEVMQKVAG